jgi:arylsulfatase A-like enzyme
LKDGISIQITIHRCHPRTEDNHQLDKYSIMTRLLAALTPFLLLNPNVLSAGEKLPNIVFILADDLGAHDVGCFGSTYYQTPNVDEIARRGVKFTQAYSASPLCSPTRSSILAGAHPARSGITQPACHLPQIQLEKKLTKPGPAMRAVNADSLTRMKPEYFTLAEALRENGYATAHFGKWHLGFNKGPNDHFEPKDQGFEMDFPHEPNAAGPGSGYLAPWKFIKDKNITGKPGEHIEDRMAEEAGKFIRSNKDKPFFVNYWAYSVHSPWNARRDYIDKFKKSADPKNPQHNPLYAAMVQSLDDGVGHLLKAIDDAGVADNTIIIFASDNGGWAYPPKTTDPEGFADMPATSNLPQRSGKASIYDGGTRTPLIVVWPGKAKPGTTSDALFQSTDFYPTLLAMCGIKPHPDVKFDGVDQSGTLKREPSPRDRIFCHFPHGTPNSNVGIPGFLPSCYVRKGDWKLIRFFADNDDGSDRLELYDLKNDAGESKNLAAENPDLVTELNGLITGFLKDTEAVVPVPNPNFSATASVQPKPKGKSKPGKAEEAEFIGLEGWKARGCMYETKDGIVTVTPTGKMPFLGTGSSVSGPATFKFRARSEKNGEAKIEWLKPGADKNNVNAASVTYALNAGDWQDLSVAIPAEGALGLIRLYLPAQSDPVEIDWIELQGAGAKKRWDF